jgi:predicted GNAT superfamily acetyltransferase
MPGGLRQLVLGVSNPSHEHRQKRERDLRMALEDAPEMPTLDPERGRRLGRSDGGGAGEFIEERHLPEDVARSERRELRLLAAPVLHDVDFSGTDDEGAHAGVALANDLVARLVTLLDRGVRDGLERALIEILEHGDPFQEVETRGHGGDASRYSRSMPGFRVTVAEDIAACALTVPLQEETWSGDVVVPPQLMLAVVHNGGFVALGYADGDDRPAGFVFGFLGIHDYHFRHHSHMLAVRPEYRGTGLAQTLKEAQRDHCLDQGIEIIGWTMDPLEARNARFNFGKLGTFTRTYYRDFYGAMPDKLNQGLPSDRVYIEWPIGHDRTYKRLRGDDAPPSLEQAESEGIGYLLRADSARPGRVGDVAGASHLLLEVPSAFQDLKARDPKAALAWRLAARDAFKRAFAAGYAAVEFLRSADGRGAYLLVPQPRREPPVDTDEQ